MYNLYRYNCYGDRFYKFSIYIFKCNASFFVTWLKTWTNNIKNRKEVDSCLKTLIYTKWNIYRYISQLNSILDIKWLEYNLYLYDFKRMTYDMSYCIQFLFYFEDVWIVKTIRICLIESNSQMSVTRQSFRKQSYRIMIWSKILWEKCH